MMQQISSSINGYANRNFLIGNYCGSTIIAPDPEHLELVVVNQGDSFESLAPDGTKGLAWRSKLGFTGVKVPGDTITNGLNEAGLSFELLTSEYSDYQTVEKNQKDQALCIWKAGAWILGNFTNITEVVKAIQTIRIWGQAESHCWMTGLRISVCDENGDQVEIKFVKGELEFYDNLFRDNPLRQKDDIKDFPAIISILFSENFQKGEEIEELVRNQYSLMADIPFIKHLQDRAIYFRPIGDTSLRAIFLKNINFISGTKHFNLSLRAEKPTIIDITSQIPNTGGFWNWWSGGPQPAIIASALLPNQSPKTIPTAEKLIEVMSNN